MMPSINPLFHRTNFPSNVRCLTTPKTLAGGAGIGHYDNFNLATHTGDNTQTVKHNRQLLMDTYHLPNEPKWLNQVHSDGCLLADDIINNPNADASFTRQKDTICAVLTADCLPIFISDKLGKTIGIIHAGYQGLFNGVIEKFIKQSLIKPSDMLVFLGAGISQNALSLDKVLFEQFINKQANFASCFKQKDTSYYLSMSQLARLIFNQYGITHITGNDACTYTQEYNYFSYRRQGIHSGRMANLIWFD